MVVAQRLLLRAKLPFAPIVYPFELLLQDLNMICPFPKFTLTFPVTSSPKVEELMM
jgi:hypothetical protein